MNITFRFIHSYSVVNFQKVRESAEIIQEIKIKRFSNPSCQLGARFGLASSATSNIGQFGHLPAGSSTSIFSFLKLVKKVRVINNYHWSENSTKASKPPSFGFCQKTKNQRKWREIQKFFLPFLSFLIIITAESARFPLVTKYNSSDFYFMYCWGCGQVWSLYIYIRFDRYPLFCM